MRRVLSLIRLRNTTPGIDSVGQLPPVGRSTGLPGPTLARVQVLPPRARPRLQNQGLIGRGLLGILPQAMLRRCLEGPGDLREGLRAVGLTPEAATRIPVWAWGLGKNLKAQPLPAAASSSRSASPCEHRPGMHCAVLTPPRPYYPCPNLR